MSSEEHKVAPTDLSWCVRGTVELCRKGWPQFPPVGNSPGLYRITFPDGSMYIGQAERLDDRLYGYRRPTQGVLGEYILHSTLVRFKGALLETFTEGDLSSKAERLKNEQSAIAHAKAMLKKLHNGTQVDVATLRAMIAFHEKEIDRLHLRIKRVEHAGFTDAYMHADSQDDPDDRSENI